MRLRMFCVLILAAAGAVSLVLVFRLWRVLRSQDVKSRESVGLLIVAGSVFPLLRGTSWNLAVSRSLKASCPAQWHLLPDSCCLPISGGHTTEILRLVGSLSGAYSPRHYVIADSDEMSASKINSLELSRADRDSGTESTEYYIHRIPRSREVQQPWLSTVFTTLHSMWFSFPLVHQIKPDLVLCNGPGTCIPICVSALLLGILGIKKVIIVYVESICRVETLSLSGKILLHLSDYFFVQWPTLKEKYPKSLYLGRIV